MATAAGSNPQADRQAGERRLHAPPAARQPFCGLLGGGEVFVAMRPIDGMDDSFFYAARAINPMADKVARDASAVSADLRQFRVAPPQHRAGVRQRVRHAVADDADFGGVDGADLRQPTRRADPTPDPRHRRSRLRQSLRAGADAPLRRRPRPSRRDVQQDDHGVAPAAQPPDRRERAQRRAARLHRGGALRRARLRARRRSPTASSRSATPPPSDCSARAPSPAGWSADISRTSFPGSLRSCRKRGR